MKAPVPPKPTAIMEKTIIQGFAFEMDSGGKATGIGLSPLWRRPTGNPRT